MVLKQQKHLTYNLNNHQIMKKENPYLAKMEALDDVELLKVLKRKDDYQQEAVYAAISVATRRNLIDGNLEIISEELKENEEIEKVELIAETKAKKEEQEKINAPAKKKKKLIIRISVAVIVFIFLLSFHFVPSRMMVFPKNTLTFSHTIITESDISDLVDRYNNSSFIQRQAMSKEPFVQKLMEKGIIIEKTD